MRVLFATSNRNKVEEANRIGKRYGIRFVRKRCPYDEIRDDSAEKIVRLGVDEVYEKVKKPVIAEDSGLSIRALGGFPGSYSAFVFDRIGNDGILSLMRGKSDRRARFVTAVAYKDSKTKRVFVGKVSGSIIGGKRGKAGFGYDPIFVPGGYKRTFAEDPQLKEKISHRTKAFEKLCRWLTRRPRRSRG